MSDPKDNLVSFADIDKAKHLEISSKGGRNSYKKRAKRKATKEAVDALLSSKINSSKLKQQLIEMGIDDDNLTNQMALVVKTYTLAMNGNMNALQFLLKGFELSEMEKENVKLRKQTIKLQKEKMDLEREKNELLRAQLEASQGNEDNGVTIINDLYGLESNDEEESQD